MVDLHSHTTASDGTLTPRELVQEAARRGLRVLAITDHDSTDGLPEAIEEAQRHPSLEIVPGIEINTDVNETEIHVLGYFIDYKAEWLQALLGELREGRLQRVHRMADRLATLGMPIDPQEVFALVKEGAAGRPHVAQVMVTRGYVKSVRDAFSKYLHAGGPAYVPHKKVSPPEAIAIIRQALGVAVLAHPGLMNRDEMIPELVEAGLVGIECYYPEHSATQVAHYLRMADLHGLVATGGSDFHGPRVGPASTLGTPGIPLELYQALRARAERNFS